jgi:hypothetical protein
MAQIFPKWTNETPKLAVAGGGALAAFVTFALYWWASPWHTDVGYKPRQPVPYSHQLHAGRLEMDCRYCHNYVERGPHAGVPPTQTCMNCHSQVKTKSPKLKLVRDSWASDESIRWVKIHKLADYAYFDHSAHMGFGVGENRAAIGCESCHGRIDQMEVVKQTQPLSMSWCIDCHSNPAPNLRPVEAITKMGWTPDAAWSAKAEEIAKTLAPPGSITRARQVDAQGNEITVASYSCNGCHH